MTSIDDFGTYYDEMAERRSEDAAHSGDASIDRPTTERDFWGDCAECGLACPPHLIRGDLCPDCRRAS